MNRGSSHRRGRLDTLPAAPSAHRDRRRILRLVGERNNREEGQAMSRRFRRVALAFTAVVVVGITGGVTYAVADIGGGGVIDGCYKSQNGQLRVVDPVA